MRPVYWIILSLLAHACEAKITPEIGYSQAVLTEDRCRARPTYPGCPDFLDDIDSKSLALQGISPVNSAQGMQIQISGAGFDQNLRLSIEGEDVAVYVTSATEAFFITPKYETSGKKSGQLKKLNGRFDFSFYFLSEAVINLPSLANPELACLGETRMASDGSLVAGTRDCTGSGGIHSVCVKDGEVGCVTSLAYPAVDTTHLAANLLSGVKAGGISGTVTLPAANKVLTGTGYGTGGTALSGTLTLPSVQNVLAGSGAYGDSLAPLSPTLTLPAVGKVLTGTSYGMAGNGSTGTLTLPNVQNVLAGSGSYGDSLAALSPTLTLPAVNKVLTGTSYGVAGNGSTGTLTLPSVQNVLAGSGSYGDSLAALSPTLTLPAVNKVLTGTSYGVGGNGSAGNLTLPLAANVLTGSGVYGDPGSATTPAYSPDFPSNGNVLSSDTVNNVAGTLTLPAIGKVLTGTSYGASGNGSTGTLALPSAANVLTGSGSYGDPGSSITPAYSPDFPDTGHVLSSDTVNTAAGTLTLPAVGKVITGISYGVAGTGSTGTLTLPGASYVRPSAGTYGDPGSAVTGTLADCNDGESGCVAVGPNFKGAAVAGGTGDKILSGQSVAGVSGTVTLPVANKVLTTNSYGVGGTAISGSLTLPSAGNVLSGSGTYGDPLSATTPSLTLPAVGKVLASTSYGASGTGSTGTLTLPTAANVLAGSADYGDAASLTTATYVCPSYIRPATPAISGVTFDLSPDRINVSWGAVSGASGYIVIIRNGSAVTFTPTDGVTYSTGAQGSDTIIYAGSSTSVTYNTDVTAATTYHIAVYSYIANKIYSYLPDTSTMTSCAGLSGSWVAVPGDSTYSTTGFCVMKFEAKNVSSVATSQASGSPWGSIDQTTAMAACASLGSNIHLITNNEWMTLATNIANVASNWSGASVGSGAMNYGHSDNNPGSACAASSDDTYAYVQTDCTPLNSGTWSQKRTHTLSTGAVVWDVAGNVWDWTSYVISNNSAKPYVSADGSPQGAAYRQLSALDAGFTAMTLHDLRPINSEKSFWSDSWNSSQGIGQYYAGSNGSGGALRRGGAWSNGSDGGVFAADLLSLSSFSNSAVGFRCAASSP